MLLNNWAIAQSVNEYLNNTASKDTICRLCLQLPNDVGDIIRLHETIQKELGLVPFAVLIAADSFKIETDRESLLDAITSLFFQPSYYTFNFHPVIFLEASLPVQSDFVDQLGKKCQQQGLKEFMKYRIQTGLNINYSQFPFCHLTKQGNVEFDVLLNNWIKEYFQSDKADEIHILVANETSSDAITTLLSNESALKNKDAYRLANQFYQKERIIKQYEHELHLKSVAEKHNRMYLSIQKTGRADALEWYYHEYEVLPTWYKQFGHIIKVIIGKRSFMSLFRDDVKKNKD